MRPQALAIHSGADMINRSGSQERVAQKTEQPLAYGINELCGLLGVGRTTIHALIKSGDLPAIKIGRRTLVLAENVRAMLQTRPRV